MTTMIRLAGMMMWCGAATLGQAATAVVPAIFANVEGDNSYGYSRQLTGQQLYPASALSALPPGAVVHGMRTRLDASETRTAAVNVSALDVYLGPAMSSTLSTTFGANQAATTVHAHTGPITFAAASFPTSGSPNQFGPLIPFSNPYVYQGGGLVMTIAYADTGGYLLWDASNSISGSHWIQADLYNAQVAVHSDLGYGLIVQFEYTIPEPASFSLIATGACFVRRRRLSGL